MKMYGELQRDMGSHFWYCTVQVYTCLTSKRAFCVFSETHTNSTLLHMSRLAVGYIQYLLSTGKHHSSGAALSLVSTALVTVLATDS